MTSHAAAILMLFVALVAVSEIARRASLLSRFGRIGQLSRRSGALLMRSGVSDWQKERASQILAGRLFAASVTAGLVLLLVILPLLLLIGIDARMPMGVRDALFDWNARLPLLAMSLCYAFARYHYRHASLHPR